MKEHRKTEGASTIKAEGNRKRDSHTTDRERQTETEEERQTYHKQRKAERQKKRDIHTYRRQRKAERDRGRDTDRHITETEQDQGIQLSTFSTIVNPTPPPPNTHTHTISP